MDRQEVKRWLWRYRDLMRECRQLKDQTTSLRENIDGLKAQRLNGMPTGSAGRSDRLESAFDKLSELEAQWNKRFDEMTDALIRIDHAIGMVEDSKMRTLLRMHYIDGRTWEQVAEAMCYSGQHVYEIHNKALDAICTQIKDQSKSEYQMCYDVNGGRCVRVRT